MLGLHSPSRVFAELGKNTIDGFYQGLTDGEGDVLAFMSGLSSDLRAGIDVNGKDINNVSQYASRIDTTARDAASNAEINDTLREFKDAIGNIRIYMDSTQVSKITAPARDKVDGARQNYANRGMAVA